MAASRVGSRGAYLRFLATCGYGLSEVEQEVANTTGSETDE